MYKIVVGAFVWLVLLPPSARASSPPLVELEPGTNELSLRIVNRGTAELRCLRAAVDQERLPEWLRVSETTQAVDVPAQGESVDRLMLTLEVDKSAGETVFELPLTFEDEEGHRWVFSAVVRVRPSLPLQYELAQNYPNPFNPETVIRYAHTCRGAVGTRLVIFNALGQRVRTLLDEPQAPGFYSVVWDGRDDDGRKLSSGTYFYRLTSGSFVDVKKMTLVQ